MATPEVGTSEPLGADASRASAGSPDQPADESLALRRLGEADELVRTGQASAEGGAIRLRLDECVSLSLPLPPLPLSPVLTLSAGQDDPPLTPEAVTAIHRLVRETLPGEIALALEEDSVGLAWTPADRHAEAEATRRSRAVAGHLVHLREAARAAGEWSSALAALEARLAEHRGRAERLARVFRDHALVRLPGLGVMHLLAHRTDPRQPDAPRLVLLQSDPDLLSPGTGLGLYAALRLPEWGPSGRLTALADGLCDLLFQRYELVARRSDALEMLGEWAEPHQTLLVTLQPDTERSFDELLWLVTDLLRFTESIAHWVSRGYSPFELLGVADPGPNAVVVPLDPMLEHDTVTEQEPAPETPEPAAVVPKPKAPRPGPPARPKPAGPAPRVPAPRVPAPRVPAPRPKPPPPVPASGKPATADPVAGEPVPTAWGMPIPQPRRPGSGGKSAAIDRLSARDVVKKLGLQEEEDVDVFLSHPGYNPKKTIDIGSLALGMDRAEVQRIVESAPCLVVGPVTRSRAARIKTILEGTGATIRVVPTEEREPGPEDAEA